MDVVHQGRLSLFSPKGYQRNSCGYCGNDEGSVSYYAASDAVRVEEYEELLNRGWRRSGKVYYKQNLKRSCCPHYTMRLDPTAFTSRKDQRKAVNRWNNFVLGPSYIRSAARLCPKSRDEKKRRKTTFDLRQRVHEAEYCNLERPVDPKTKQRIEPAHRFEVNIESDWPSTEKYEVFLKYQLVVHKDPASRWRQADFKRFLGSGIRQTSSPVARGSDKVRKLGSYHQCYRLDGKIIAVAVLDLLPHSVSSVYLFYDPEYEAFDFGKLSALREIAFALETPYQYYNMGFYIHSCPKMRYKGDFRPQEILDPESLTWDFLDDTFSSKLDKRRYVSLSADRQRSQDAAESDPETLEISNRNRNSNGGEFIIPEDEDMSLFDVHMPGVLSPEEVRTQVDLDHWRVLLRGRMVEFINIVGWEDSDIRSPGSIKEFIAELAAVLGPKVVEHSAVVLS